VGLTAETKIPRFARDDSKEHGMTTKKLGMTTKELGMTTKKLG
jgi:hypothetical protein